MAACILSLGNFPFLQNAQIFPSPFVAPFAILQRSCGEQLHNLAGFTPDDGAGASHRATGAWYAGTANLNESRLPSENGDPIYRRLGDLSANNITDATKTWYTPDHTNANFTGGNGDTNAPWEGIGTGWFHSVLGGGSQLRPYDFGGKKGKTELGNFEDYLNNNRAAVYEDNTYTDITKSFGTRMRGDYAVPTLFNGNFDAIAGRISAQNIPGWSLFNGSSDDTSQSNLVDWYTIGEQEQNTAGNGLIGSGYLDAISYDVARPNFALRMGAGGAKQITHNYFVMPEWGDLRFNLHAPYQNPGKLKVVLETQPEIGSDGRPIIGSGTHVLKEIDLAADPGNSLETYASDIDKVGFGRGGFETFHVDSVKLDKFRGQAAKLRFEVEGNTRVYLDDVFFKSNHLKFGNPSEARYNSAPPNFTNPNTTNLLIEKPQYVVSYDRSNLNPAWVSWQVNKSWLGNSTRPETIFAGDPQLPEGWPKIDTSYYKNAQNLSWGFDQGHGIPSGDRTNHEKDNLATFLGTNLIPQSVDNNRFFGNPNDPAQASAWYNVEQLTRNLAKQGKEIYVVAGSYGTDGNSQKRSNAHPDEIDRGYTNSEAFRENGINIPAWTWKTLLIMDRPGQGIADVSQNTKVYTFLTPNKAEPFANWTLTGQPVPHPFNQIQDRLGLTAPLPDIQNAVEWRNPSTWQITINQLENLIDGKGGRKIDFLSNLPENIQTYLKERLDPII
ncbi:DNA/RNA non-specific endonuclease [Oscillatoria nigro-viridis]|uniref:DNA/RNA non-specific endonuclease n=1 Tax=Phormidium nigroviride TaxID=482564 RepID=UPI0006852BF7